MSENLLAIYCLILSAKRLRAEELTLEDIYNSVDDRFSESPRLWIPLAVVVLIAFLLIVLWLMCWCFQDCIDEEESTQSGEGSPNIISPVIVLNENQPRIVSIQRTETTEPKPKGCAKTQDHKTPMKEVSIRLEEQSNGQSIDANNSKQTTSEKKNETQEKSNAKNTMVSLKSAENIVSTSNQKTTTGAQPNVV